MAKVEIVVVGGDSLIDDLQSFDKTGASND